MIEENLEAQLPSGREEEKGGTELNQVDAVWFVFIRNRYEAA